MFTGDLSVKKINLGGASRAVDRNALIEKQRKDRNEREAFRKRQNACLVIQRTTRGFFSRSCTRKILIGDLQRKLFEYGRLEDLKMTFDDYSEVKAKLLAPLKLIQAGEIDQPLLEELLYRLFAVKAQYFPTIEDILRVRSLLRHMLTYPELSEAVARVVDVVPFIADVVRGEDVDRSALFRAIPVGRVYEILRATLSSDCVTAALRVGIDLLPVVDTFRSLPFLSDKKQGETIAQQLAKLWMESPEIEVLDQWLLFSHECCSGSAREETQSILLSGLDLIKPLSSHRVQVIVSLVDFEKVSDDAIFGIATHSNLVQVLAEQLIILLGDAGFSETLNRTVGAFAAVYARIVGAAFRSALRVDTIETLFPLLNEFVYDRLVRPEPVSPKLVALLRSVHAKKHLYPNLQRDQVWVVPSSVSHIPSALNSYEIIDRLEREELDLLVGEGSQQLRKKSSIFETLLEEIPHVIPFEHRLRIFASTLAEDQSRQRHGSSVGFFRRVRRDHLLQDGLETIELCGRDIVRIEFVSSDGSVESGIDGGGLFKEFMQQWTTDMMNESNGLFRQLSNARLSPCIDPGPDKLYRATGKAVGKALYEMVLLETHFGESFLSRVLGKPFNLEHLKELDETLFHNLKFVTECDRVEDLSLTFSVSSSDMHQEIDLIPGGRNVAVTRNNALRYVLLASWFHLSRQLDKPAAAFAAGLSEVFPLSWLRMFSPSEINLLISGEQRKGFSVEELKNNVVLGGGYVESSETIKLLWQVLAEFSDADRSAFLAFVTSAPRPPLLGFRVLHPKFGINRVPEPDRLPTSSTCTNLLKLPDYRNKEVLKNKLLAAIYSQSGFDLS